MRSRRSSKRDLRALQEITKGGKFYKVNLRSDSVESVLTNSSRIATLLEEADYRACKDIGKILEEEVKAATWDRDIQTFEQHMQEEGDVQRMWMNGNFQKE